MHREARERRSCANKNHKMKRSLEISAPEASVPPSLCSHDPDIWQLPEEAALPGAQRVRPGLPSAVVHQLPCPASLFASAAMQRATDAVVLNEE